MAAAAQTGAALLTEAVVYLAAAVALVPLFVRLGLGSVLGYLAAGILIGPQVLGLVSDPDRVLRFAELGIVLLLFVIGLELKPLRLWALRHDILGLGTLQVVLCGLAITGLLLLDTRLTWQAALVVGLSLAMSSTALVVQYLREQGQLNTPAGERIFAILLLQDIAIVPLLIIVAALSRVPAPDAPEGWELLGRSVAAVVGLAVAGRFLLQPVFRLLAQVGTREIFVIGALLTVLGAALLMASLGLSMALGAFVAGVMLADSPWRHEVEADIEPFRGLLLGLFFVSVGMTLELSVVLEDPLRILKMVAALMLAKAVIIALIARLFGAPWTDARFMGLLLSQGGEFAFVILGAATAGLLITQGAASLFAAVVTVSMLATFLVMWLWRRLAAGTEPQARTDGLPLPEEAPGGLAIVIGYGRFGQIVTQMLHARGVDVVLIDRKPEQIERSRQYGWRVYYGDGFRPDVLRAAGAERARVLVVTTGGGSWDPARLDPVRAAFPHLSIIVRAHDRAHAMAFVKADLPLAVRELFMSAVEAGQMALAELGTPEETIAAITEEFIRRDAERFALQLASGDMMAGLDIVFRPGHGWHPDPPRPARPPARPEPEEHPAVEHPDQWTPEPAPLPAIGAAFGGSELAGDPVRDPAAAPPPDRPPGQA